MSTTSAEKPAARPADAEETAADVARLIREEYDEMPGLALTCPQVCRMWGLDRSTCDAVVRDLVKAGSLVLLPSGSYAKRRTRM